MHTQYTEEVTRLVKLPWSFLTIDCSDEEGSGFCAITKELDTNVWYGFGETYEEAVWCLYNAMLSAFEFYLSRGFHIPEPPPWRKGTANKQNES